MATRGFIGTWEIIAFGHVNGASFNANNGLEGIRFRLDESGDVTWTVPEELKSVPLFSCETYELCTTTVLGLGVVIRFGAYAGHVLEFRADQIEPVDTVVFTCEGFCMIHCKRVSEELQEINQNNTFSLLPALEDGYFSDITIVSSNKKQFKVHFSILELQASDIDWHSDPPPFSNLPEDVLGTILHFLYAECLPENLNEATARQVVAAAAPHPCLSKLANICKIYLKNMALKQQIIGLVNDMHSCLNQIIEYFNKKNNQSASDNISSNPAKLCFIVKQSIRDAAVAGVKLLLLCDLFTKRKGELSRSERHEILKYAKSRLPIFLTQLQRFLQALRSTFSSMSCVQRLEVASFLVPEIEVILDSVSALSVQVDKALQEIIQGLSPELARGKTNVSDALGKTLRNVLHMKELTKLKIFQEHITYTLGLLMHKKETFNELSPSQKVRSVARNLEQLIEELPMFLLRLEEDTAAFDDRLEWKEFKFCFKVGTSKVSGILQKLVAHRESLQDIIQQICELVQRDAFTQSLQHLDLLDTSSSSSSNPSEAQKMSRSCSFSTPKHQHGYKLNLVESLCVPPSVNNSALSKLSIELLKSGAGTDMEFEVVCSSQDFSESAEDSSCEENCIIKAHRVIVAARCDWFRRALLSGMRESIDKKIVIHDTSPFLFKIFLEYLYSGRLRQGRLSTEHLVELLLLSDRYEVDSLKHTCEYALQSSIEMESVLYFLSLADQYNARILRHACLSFISQHHELTESEVFFELPISLQAEIFDCVWTQPPPRKSLTMEQLLPNTSSTSPSSPTDVAYFPPNSGMTGLQKAVNCLVLSPESRQSNSSSLEDLPMAQSTGRLDGCITQLRDIVGDAAPRDQLIQVILAADYDLCRALNYYYAKTSGEE